MVYYDVERIKNLVGLPASDTSKNDDLKKHGVEAQDDIDSILGVHTTVPLTKPTDQVRRLCNRLAAAWYNYWNSPVKDMQPIHAIRKLIELYALNTYVGKTEDTAGNMFEKTDSAIDGF